MPKKKPAKKIFPKPKKAVVPAKIAAAPPPVEKTPEPLQPPRGMRDILPADESGWALVEDSAARMARAFGYGRIETPLLESRSLFVRGIGADTDVVQKEMYCFKDQGGDELCLRPEGTAAVARAYINHGMLNLPQPVKLWYLGPMFRRDRPQAGRYRQFHQWSAEIFGDPHPILDTEIIALAMAFFQELKLPVRLEMNSIGCGQCRGAYKEALLAFYASKAELLCETCKVRLKVNRLRLLDCKEPQCELLKEGAPQITDALCEGCRDHFMKVLEYLDEINIPYQLNPYIVRGLDYYNRTVFEIMPEVRSQKSEVSELQNENEIKDSDHEKDLTSDLRSPTPDPRPLTSGAQSALGGGGRYDGLVEQLGGRATAAVGFSIGLERVLSALRESGQELPRAFAPRIFIAQLGDAARRRALSLWQAVAKDIPVTASLSKDGLKAQLEIANRLGVRYAIILGQKEILDNTAIIRDMEAGIQEVVDYSKVVAEIKKKIGG